MFITGQLYRRQELHEKFGGQHQTGISTPAKQPFIFLFTSEDTFDKHKYEDGWTSDGTFSYSGQGRTGDMVFVAGNAAVRDHAANGKDLHLFENAGRGMVRYLGQMVSAGYQVISNRPDSHGNLRSVIQFHLVPLSATADQTPTEQDLRSLNEVPHDDFLDSRQDPETSCREAKALVRQRTLATKAVVLARANGNCEGCGNAAPFVALDGTPYLETHHVRRLTDGGPDDPRWVIALCPNCHQKAHKAIARDAFNDELMLRLMTVASTRMDLTISTRKRN
ncbi:MAG: HNH endonuclease [Thermomicrobiales bacterium]|nr:HNH endonuclease [Thermomicrobiales bacterium]MCO5222581.1 HNH endonuclease [Thermomicrobiales bacterium]